MKVLKSLSSALPSYAAVLAVMFCGLPATSAWAVATPPALSQGINEFDRNQFRAVPGLPEALVAAGRTSTAENTALDSASGKFLQAPRAGEDFAMHAEPLAQFTRSHPRSAWNASILINLGLGYYRAGYFGKAITAFRGAWEAGKESSNPTVMAIADRALGELAVMYARVGESALLAEVLQAADTREIRGPATELIGSARESLWTFREEPGGAYLCGPKALKNLLTALKFDAGVIEEVDRIKSPQGGFSLADVSAFARAAGLEHRLVLRQPGADVPFPAIVHWKVAHFAAILAERDGKYLVVDPTFGTPEFWVSKAAIDAESTGYFLVPAVVASRAGWESTETDRVVAVRGKGSTAFNDPNAYKPSDEMLHPDDPSCGMCRVNAMLMLVSARLTDTPVGYRPAIGPSAFVRLTYNQREGNFPASFNYFNIGPNWGINFLSFVEDDPNDFYVGLKRYEIGGGAIQYPSYGTYGMYPDGRQGWAEPRTGNVIRRVPRDGPVSRYELLRPDGGKYVYERFDGASSGLRRVFLTRIVDPAGNTLTLSYDKDLRLTALTDATGRSTLFKYPNNSRRISTITDPFGRSASLEYNSNGYLSAIVDVLGIRSSFQYGYFGRTSPPLGEAMSTPGGYVVQSSEVGSIQFPPQPGMPGASPTRGEYLVTSMTTPYGTTKLSFGWNEKENTRFLNITDPLGQTERIEFRHKAPGITSTEPDAPGGIFGPNCCNNYLEFRNTFYWNSHAYSVAKGDYKKAKIYHWRHANANTTSGILESVKEPLQSRILFEYAEVDRYVRAVSQILDDGTLRATTFQLESSGKPTEMYDARGRRFNFQYDYSFGAPLLAAVFANNYYATIARMTYNSQRKPITYTDAAGQVTHATYNAAGQMTGMTDPLGNSTTRHYDALGRLTAIINPRGVTQASFTYDAFDRIDTATDSEGYQLAYLYDALNRVTRVTYPDATTTEYGYDKLDLSSVKDRLGRVTRFAYDGNRRMTQVTDPLSRVTAYSYHENGRLKSITDPKGNVTSWEIDIQGRPTAKRYADGTKESYAYEPKSGRLASITDARGYSKTYTYNLDDTLAAISYPASSGTPNVTFGYDTVLPRMVTMRDGTGETRFTYGPFGQGGAFGPIGANRLIKEDGPYSNDTIDYGYDAAGRVVSRTIDNQTETFVYDALGRVERNVNGLGAFDIRYLGQTRQMVSMASPTVGTNWLYLDNVGDRRLEAIGHVGAGRGFSYTTTAESRIVGMREGVSGGSFTQAWSYDYDDADRLMRATPFSGDRLDYGYDAADNITSIGGAAATYNTVNQIRTFGSVPYTHDAAGNVLDDGSRTYQWDAENRLIGIGYKGQSGRKSTFRYDGLGRRVAIVETAVSGSAETRYTWCGISPCQARNASDTTTGLFYRQGASIAGGAKLYFARDHLGSVRNALDATTGASISAYDFDPYGKQIGGGSPVAFGFAGMFNHQASGLNLTWFRAYDSKSARWLSRDRLGEAQGTNLYEYARLRPTSMVDRTGLAPRDKLYGYPPEFWDWWEREKGRRQSIDILSQEEADEMASEWDALGRPTGDKKKWRGKDVCEVVKPEVDPWAEEDDPDSARVIQVKNLLKVPTAGPDPEPKPDAGLGVLIGLGLLLAPEITVPAAILMFAF
jgi:RHS repeat-associated protein